MNVKLGIIGVGEHMRKRLSPLLAGAPVELTAVCDLDENKCRNFARFFHVGNQYTDFRQMIACEEMDGLICAGNAALHYEAAKECMLHGISPFVEKTPCTSYDQALELLELQRVTGCFTMVGFNRRYATAYQMAKTITETPEFGTPSMYMAKYHSSPYQSEEYFVWNHVIHHLDLARYFMGEIEQIRADKIKLSEQKVGFHISFVTVSGALGFIQSSSCLHEPYPMERLEICGEERAVIVDNVKQLEYNRPQGNKDELNPVLGVGEGALCWKPNHGHSSLYGHYGFERELETYLEAICNRTIPKSTFFDIAGTIKLVETMQQNTILRKLV